jgi:hypothetical protein
MTTSIKKYPALRNASRMNSDALIARSAFTVTWGRTAASIVHGRGFACIHLEVRSADGPDTADPGVIGRGLSIG